jgi:hypothetical protein
MPNFSGPPEHVIEMAHKTGNCCVQFPDFLACSGHFEQSVNGITRIQILRLTSKIGKINLRRANLHIALEYAV